jgi:hypothetical protein
MTLFHHGTVLMIDGAPSLRRLMTATAGLYPAAPCCAPL